VEAAGIDDAESTGQSHILHQLGNHCFLLQVVLVFERELNRRVCRPDSEPA